jgi:hypothetical protein
MIWHILGIASLFFNFENTDKLVRDNSELISINKTHIAADAVNITTSNLLNHKPKEPKTYFKKQSNTGCR